MDTTLNLKGISIEIDSKSNSILLPNQTNPVFLFFLTIRLFILLLVFHF